MGVGRRVLRQEREERRIGEGWGKWCGAEQVPSSDKRKLTSTGKWLMYGAAKLPPVTLKDGTEVPRTMETWVPLKTVKTVSLTCAPSRGSSGLIFSVCLVLFLLIFSACLVLILLVFSAYLVLSFSYSVLALSLSCSYLVPALSLSWSCLVPALSLSFLYLVPSLSLSYSYLVPALCISLSFECLPSASPSNEECLPCARCDLLCMLVGVFRMGSAICCTHVGSCRSRARQDQRLHVGVSMAFQ